MKTISLTIPLDDYNALSRASDMLHGLALDCSGDKADEPGKSAGGAATETQPTTATAGDAGSAGNEPTGVDPKGVTRNAQLCANAKEPFYSSGPRSGQWKKARGVDDTEYDAWYAAELAKVNGKSAGEESINTAGAFGGGDQQQQPQPPADTGALMAWISEKQAAGLLTQENIQDAYATAGVNVVDLFPPNPPETIAEHIFNIYRRLVSITGA